MYHIEYNGKYWTGSRWCRGADRDKFAKEYPTIKDAWAAAELIEDVEQEDISVWRKRGR